MQEYFLFLGEQLSEATALSEVKENTALDQLEKEMVNEVQALFNKYRDKLQQLKNCENNGNTMSVHSTV